MLFRSKNIKILLGRDQDDVDVLPVGTLVEDVEIEQTIVDGKRDMAFGLETYRAFKLRVGESRHLNAPDNQRRAGHGHAQFMGRKRFFREKLLEARANAFFGRDRDGDSGDLAELKTAFFPCQFDALDRSAAYVDAQRKTTFFFQGAPADRPLKFLFSLSENT